ncbi:MAG: hypothetical protein C4296_12780 [Gemmataceae bacterium]
MSALERYTVRACIFLALCMIALVAYVPYTWGGAEKKETPVVSRLGERIADVRLKTLDGDVRSLSAHKGKRATVIVFFSPECPMANAYLPVLGDLARRFAAEGVAFFLVHPGPVEAKSLTAHLRAYDTRVPLLVDEAYAAVRALDARVTPEAFVLDGEGVLRYRGRIDDGYWARLRTRPQISREDLRVALEEVLAGKPVSVASTVAYGCTIEKPADGKEDTPARQGPVTFYRDIVPILQNKCQSCHRPGEVAPFSLVTYEQARRWGKDIKEFTQNGQMPPWKPVQRGMYVNERSLSPRELDLLARWVDAGMPAGDPAQAPPAPRFTSGWQLGEPDLVLEMPEEMVIGPTGRDLFRCFVFPTHLPEDKFVRAVEVRPGNPRVVHHTVHLLDTRGVARRLEEAERKRPKSSDEVDRGPGYSTRMGVGFIPLDGELGGWAPGLLIRPMPPGVGYLLPKGADIVVQIHYHRTGKLERDRTRIGLYFADGPVTHRYLSAVLAGLLLAIPANNDHFVVRGRAYAHEDLTLYTVFPHMHLLGKSIRCTVTFPDGSQKELINIPRWDYLWQEMYFLNEPMHIPTGTRFDLEAVYDNSENNPLNPNSPPKPVRLGQQTTDEMCFVFLGVTSDRVGAQKGFRPVLFGPAPPRQARGETGQSDKQPMKPKN